MRVEGQITKLEELENCQPIYCSADGPTPVLVWYSNKVCMYVCMYSVVST